MNPQLRIIDTRSFHKRLEGVSLRRTFNWSSGPDIRPVLQITIDGLRADIIDRYVIGKQPVDLKGQAFWDAEKSSGAANWSLQFQVKFLFPKKAKISEND